MIVAVKYAMERKLGNISSSGKKKKKNTSRASDITAMVFFSHDLRHGKKKIFMFIAEAQQGNNITLIQFIYCGLRVLGQL